MRITAIDERPFFELPYFNAAGGGRVARESLPFIMARADHLPSGVGALIAAADLQGRDIGDGVTPGPLLLGIAVVEALRRLASEGRLPGLSQSGVLLAGDLYAEPGAIKRGGNGDVLGVWSAFAEECRWVAGVAGNHDVFGESPQDLKEFKKNPKVSLLHGEHSERDGIRIAGICGVFGNPRRPFRNEEPAWKAAFDRLLAARSEVLILHEGPDIPGDDSKGSPFIRAQLLRSRDLLVICGHTHRNAPLAELGNGVQVLNVDSRVVILLAE